MAFNIKTYGALLDDIKTWIVANQDKVSDFNEGSVILSMIEAFSRQLEQAYIRTRIGFQDYLKDIPYNTFGFARKEGLYAAGQVRFTATKQAAQDIAIPTGTRVTTMSGLEFVTTADVVFPAGGTQSPLVNIVAVKVGKESNVPPLAITVIPSPISGVDAATNPLGTTGGLDVESDYEFQQRFIEYIAGLGKSSTAGLITGAKTVNGVRSVTVVEHIPRLTGIYDGSIYIDDGTGSASAAMLSQVQSVIDGDGTETNPGYRASGLKYRIVAPTKVLIDITATVVSDGSLDRVVLKQNIETALTGYVNALNLGEDVVVNRIVDVIMSQPGVYDQNLTVPNGNVTIGDSQIARIGTLSITVS